MEGAGVLSPESALRLCVGMILEGQQAHLIRMLPSS